MVLMIVGSIYNLFLSGRLKLYSEHVLSKDNFVCQAFKEQREGAEPREKTIPEPGEEALEEQE